MMGLGVSMLSRRRKCMGLFDYLLAKYLYYIYMHVIYEYNVNCFTLFKIHIFKRTSIITHTYI